MVRAPHLAPLLLAAGLVSGSGCLHRAVIQSDPPGAEVSIRDKVVGTTPVTLNRVVLPGRRIPITVRHRGYRTVTVRLDKDIGPVRWLGEVLTLRLRRAFGLKVRRTHELVLMRKHGRSGTWSPADARKD